MLSQSISDPVNEKYSVLILVLGCITTLLICLGTTPCVKYARDSTLILNTYAMRQQAIRNMEIYLVVKEMQKKELQRPVSARTPLNPALASESESEISSQIKSP